VEGVVGSVGTAEGDGELVPFVVEFARLRADRDARDLHISAAVEDDGVEPGVERGDGVRHRTANLALLGVERELGLDVADVESADPLDPSGRPGAWRMAAGRPVRLCPGQAAGPAPRRTRSSPRP
jgi:hypothetical protein